VTPGRSQTRLPGPVRTHYTAPKEPKGEAILPEMVVSRYGLASYVSGTMLYAFSLPTKADKAPAGSDYLHEIKYDG
jgi:hypothetical protein